MTMQLSVIGGGAAALWLAGLWYAAPLLGGRERADRLRDTLALGTMIPLTLGIVHALYAPTCAIVLLTACTLRRVRTPSNTTPQETNAERLLWVLPLITTVAIALPPLLRPLLEGDSLGYHLPNAVAWVHAGSIWTTTTRYWWYPGGSELFAAALFAIAGPFSIGLAGVGPAALLGMRAATWARTLGCRPQTAGAIGALIIATTPVALQAGTLENDVWLGAFFLEALWAGTRTSMGIGRSTAMCTLLKPSGFLYALLAWGLAKRQSPMSLGPAFVPFAVWCIHDAALWRTALLPPADTGYPHLFATTIIGQGTFGLTLLLSVLAGAGPATVLVASAGFGGLIWLGDRRLILASLAALGLFLVTPFGFATNVPQLASGHSLRLLIPFLALCGVGLAQIGQRFSHITTGSALLATLAGVTHISAIFRSDAHTYLMLPALLALTAIVMLSDGHLRSQLFAYGFAVAVIFTNVVASSAPAAYYNDWIADGGEKPKLFTWLAGSCPARVIGWDLRIGAVAMLCPNTDMQDARGTQACLQARANHALLIDGRDAVADPQRFQAHRAATRECGPLVFMDSAALVVAP